jgi:hypothetical protein
MRLTVGGGEAGPGFSQTSNILGASPECMVWNGQFPLMWVAKFNTHTNRMVKLHFFYVYESLHSDTAHMMTQYKMNGSNYSWI